MNVACCLLVAAAAFLAWYHNEYIVVAHLHLLIGSSSTIIIDAYLHSLASPLSYQQSDQGLKSSFPESVLPSPGNPTTFSQARRKMILSALCMLALALSLWMGRFVLLLNHFWQSVRQCTARLLLDMADSPTILTCTSFSTWIHNAPLRFCWAIDLSA